MLHASDGAVAEMDLEDALALSSLSTFDRYVVAGAIVERRLAMADERGASVGGGGVYGRQGGGCRWLAAADRREPAATMAVGGSC